MIQEYNKLVRDKIPEIIRADNKTPYTHKVSGSELEDALQKKLTEEIREFRKSRTMEELADILEVVEALIQINHEYMPERTRVYSIANNYNITKMELESIRANKAKERGTFSQGIILEYVEY